MTQARVKRGDLWVDCTLGRGGHTLGLLKQGASVIALDRDGQALQESHERLAPFITSGQLITLHSDFRDLYSALTAQGIVKVAGVLADLGVSSPQLDRPERGFSFQSSGPLDMRMDQSQGISAAEWIIAHDVRELEYILRSYGEEPRARALAKVIKAWSDEGEDNTLSLARRIESHTPMKVRRALKKHPATRAFQALRIAVNDELGALEQLLDDAPSLLQLNGQLLLISFHSLEDRLIKRAFKTLSEPPAPPRRGLPPPPSPPPQFTMLPKKGVVADDDERTRNPRARSARLRSLQRIKESL